MPTIAIIGSGFSGTLTAVHLLRLPGVDVHLFDASAKFGPGLAYSTTNLAHLLNVPAGNMSAFDDQPAHFLEYARERDPAVASGSFVPRAWYGSYLNRVLQQAAAHAPSVGSRLHLHPSEVTRLDRDASGFRVHAARASGVLQADAAVLALGNFPPPPVPGLDEQASAHPGYIANPWLPDALNRLLPDEPVFIVGTGLTMVDVALALHAREHTGRVIAVSRHGLLPRPHRSPSKPPIHRAPPPALSTWNGTARELLHIVRQQVRQSALQGTDWRDIITSLRPVTHELWNSLPPDQKRRFLVRLRSFWEIVRHRAAPEAAATLNDLLASRRLSVRAGSIMHIRPAGHMLDVTFRPRGSALAQTHRVARVVNCLGPQSDLRRISNPLVRQLINDGLISADPFGLGINITANDLAVTRDGTAIPRLFVVGPLGKGRSWENTAVPELRKHAQRVASGVMTAIGAAAITVCAPDTASSRIS